MVDVMKTVCCVSVLPSWQRLRAYNLRVACEQADVCKESTAEGSAGRPRASAARDGAPSEGGGTAPASEGVGQAHAEDVSAAD